MKNFLIVITIVCGISSFDLHASLDEARAQIKYDSSVYSLEDILAHAENYPSYKKSLRYQQIVDMYYQVNPYLVNQAREAVQNAGRYISIDCGSGITGGMIEFLKAYRKIPTGKQNIKLNNIIAGAPYIDGIQTSDAKVIVDWMKRHSENFSSSGVLFGGSQIQKLLNLLDA